MYSIFADSSLALYVIVCVLLLAPGATVTAVDEAALGVYPTIVGDVTAGKLLLAGVQAP